jgi:hypothetical protein
MCPFCFEAEFCVLFSCFKQIWPSAFFKFAIKGYNKRISRHPPRKPRNGKVNRTLAYCVNGGVSKKCWLKNCDEFAFS